VNIKADSSKLRAESKNSILYMMKCSLSTNKNIFQKDKKPSEYYLIGSTRLLGHPFHSFLPPAPLPARRAYRPEGRAHASERRKEEKHEDKSNLIMKILSKSLTKRKLF
jgi:hypothetical protein